MIRFACLFSRRSFARLRSRGAQMLVALAILLGVAAPAFADGTCTVTSTADDGSSTGTLRACVLQAAAADDGTQTITFQLPPLSVITLTSSISATIADHTGIRPSIVLQGPAGGGSPSRARASTKYLP